jgi:arginase family enzyme
MLQFRRCGDSLRFELQTPVYLSLDIDALDPAFAPGVSHREPGGLSTRQVINLIQAIAHRSSALTSSNTIRAATSPS